MASSFLFGRTTTNWRRLVQTSSRVAVVVAGGAAWCDDERSRWREVHGDAYDGIAVDAAALRPEHQTAEAFRRVLRTSTAEWTAQRRRGVWLTIPRALAHLIPVACDEAFEFHTAAADRLVLTRWLPDDEPNPLPPNASHQVGVGCVVVDATGRHVVLVRERWGVYRGWKVPTGLVEPRETIEAAALRECEEETGLRAEFDRVVAIRHSHRAPFGKSDLFFLCVLKAGGATPGAQAALPALRPQAAELADARWAPFAEFVDTNRHGAAWQAMYDLCRDDDSDGDDDTATVALGGRRPGRQSATGIHHRTFDDRRPEHGAAAKKPRPPPTVVFFGGPPT